MDSIKLVIKGKYNQMSKGERCISDFVLPNVTDCLNMTAVDTAKKDRISSASVIRYVQKLGYDGLEGLELTLAVASFQGNEWKVVDPIISTDDNLDELINKFGVPIDGAMRDLFYQLDKDAPQKAIDVVKHTRGICLVGIEAPTLPAYDSLRKPKRADSDVSYYFGMNMQVESFNYIDERDVIIVFSYSGQFREVLYPCRIAKEMKPKVIAMTRNRESVLQQIVDICLTVPDKGAVVRIGAFTSLHTSIMMGGPLYLGAIQEDLERIEVELIKTGRPIERLKTGPQEGSIYGKY